MSDTFDTAALARKLGVDFEDLDLLATAVTHPSWTSLQGGGNDYQRLEFLGDSVLGYVAAQLLFRRFPDVSEGELTRMKTTLVSGAVLAKVADEIGLTPAIRLGEGSDLRERPSVREAVFEAVVAAVYLDRGVAAAEEFVARALGDRIDPEVLLATTDDPKSRLQEFAQGKGLGLPAYHIVSREGPPHAPTFTVEVQIRDRLAGVGVGTTKQAAEQAAAAEALARSEASPEQSRPPGGER